MRAQQDKIDVLGISKISLNTGDELRARITYVYDNVDKAYQVRRCTCAIC